MPDNPMNPSDPRSERVRIEISIVHPDEPERNDWQWLGKLTEEHLDLLISIATILNNKEDEL